MSAVIAWVDGALVPRGEARVSIDDFGFRYGLTCFETMLVRNGNVFRLDEHLARLEEGLRLFRADPPRRTALKHAIKAVLEANGLTEASVRLSVTPGPGSAPALPASGAPTVVVTADPIGPRHPRERLWVSAVRLDASRPWRGAKVAQFAPYLLARAEAEERGADDALILDQRGHIAEASTANAFFLVDGALLTPPASDGPLPGITRGAILEVAPSLGVPAREATVTLHDLERAAAVFLSSSIVGIAPVRTIGWEDAGQRHLWQSSGAGAEAFTALSAAYESLVRSGTE